jgi:SAM-dependent methyltransferase
MVVQEDILDRVNRRTYASAKVVAWYDDLDFIHQPEAVILQKLTPFIKDKKLLDIGIGGGRTTKFLLEISKNYTGIDYTPQCVQVVKCKYPEANILCCDARDLSAFDDESFDFVLFSFNSIDYVAHEDRIKVLREIRRVLLPDGFFMFSTHNRDYRYFNKFPWQEGVRFDLNFLKNCLGTLAFIPRHLIMKRHEIYTAEYAIINDNAHGFSLLAYYIGIGEQMKQLKGAGFVNVEVYDWDGKQIDNDTVFPWTYYLVQKPLV